MMAKLHIHTQQRYNYDFQISREHRPTKISRWQVERQEDVKHEYYQQFPKCNPFLKFLKIYIFSYCDNFVGIATGYGLESRVRFSAGAKFFLFSTASTPSLGLTQPAVQWVPGLLTGDKAAKP
jgi:hypothetical protein